MVSPGHVVVVGAGLAGLGVARALREREYPGRISLLGAEPYPPYDRPPLSKAVLLCEEPPDPTPEPPDPTPEPTPEALVEPASEGESSPTPGAPIEPASSASE